MVSLQSLIDANYLTTRDQVKAVATYLAMKQYEIDTSGNDNFAIVDNYFQIFCKTYANLFKIGDCFEDDQWTDYFQTGCARFAEVFILANKNDFKHLQKVVDMTYSFKSLLNFKLFFDTHTEQLMDYSQGAFHPYNTKSVFVQEQKEDSMEEHNE